VFKPCGFECTIGPCEKLSCNCLKLLVCWNYWFSGLVWWNYLSQPHFETSENETHTPKSGNLESSGTPQIQSSIIKVKTPCIEVFFIPLKRPWSVNVENGLSWAIQTFTAQVMVKRRAESQTNSLTPDHKKSGIDPTPVCADRVRYTIGKILRRATRLLQTSYQSKVWDGSYELSKSQESKPGQFRDSSLGVPGIKAIWMRVQQSNAENTIWGRWWLPPSLGRGDSSESKVARGLSQHQKGA